MTLTIFDSSTVAPARQFDMFFEAINQQVVRITPQRPEGTDGFPARILSYRRQARSCHIIEAPSHTASRTVREITSSDPNQIHLNYIVAGDRRLRVRDRDTAEFQREVQRFHAKRSLTSLPRSLKRAWIGVM